MRKNMAVAAVILLLGLTVSSTAWARGFGGAGPGAGGGFHGGAGFHGGPHSGGFHHHHHSHSGVGVVIGAPLFWPWYYPPAYYYPYPPLAVAPGSPPVYVERQSEEAQTDGTGTWFYCANPQGYYPYVQQCNGAWQQVPAQASPTQ